MRLITLVQLVSGVKLNIYVNQNCFDALYIVSMSHTALAIQPTLVDP